MKNLNRLIVSAMFCMLSFSACDTSSKKESKEETSDQKQETAEVLNANLASDEMLKNVGLNDAIINIILENRPFMTMNALDAYLGPDVNKDRVYQRVFVPFNLNTTAEENFKMIPGVGDKMAHEFEEYRPYISIKQFRKEIGKYVNAEEVARYEQYVFVPVELNTASEDDILALPGLDRDMAHEFEEYRPYADLEQFSREISKYVDDKELRRLERLVYLKR